MDRIVAAERVRDGAAVVQRLARRRSARAPRRSRPSPASARRRRRSSVVPSSSRPDDASTPVELVAAHELPTSTRLELRRQLRREPRQRHLALVVGRARAARRARRSAPRAAAPDRAARAARGARRRRRASATRARSTARPACASSSAVDLGACARPRRAARASASALRCSARRGSRSSARNAAQVRSARRVIVPSSLRPARSSSISFAASRTRRAAWRRADLEVALELGLVEQERAPHRVQRGRDELLARLEAAPAAAPAATTWLKSAHEQARQSLELRDAVVLEQRA